MQGTVRINAASQSKDYARKVLTQRKSVPLIHLPGLVNMMDAIENIQKNAPRFGYAFLLMQGELDTVVSNRKALVWYDNATSAPRKEKVEFAGFCHELHKEPGKAQVFKYVLQYLSKQLSQPKVVVWKKPQTLRQGLLGRRSPSKFRRLIRLLLTLYFVVGCFLAIAKRNKGLLLKWPTLLLGKK